MPCGGLTRDPFRRFHEFVEVAFVDTRPFHPAWGAIADVCEMFKGKRLDIITLPRDSTASRQLGG
jgi:hypothetical protein